MKPKVKIQNRETGYYWVKTRSGLWMIAKWWNSLQFWDTMRTLENDTRPPFPKEVDERRLTYTPREEVQVRRVRKPKEPEVKQVKRRRRIRK